LAISVALEKYPELNLVGHAALDEVSHVLPIGSLISRRLPFWKLELPICHYHLSWLRGVEVLDDFIIFLLKGFNSSFNLKWRLKLLETTSIADLCGKLCPSLDRVDDIW
jgi:hypothetical protein